ncbi:TPA: hypothetical protein DCW54_00300 [Candidatus Dependentiae bacterium]|nr:hypothetical protein [Candidatus Dependentiae bacterium]
MKTSLPIFSRIFVFFLMLTIPLLRASNNADIDTSKTAGAHCTDKPCITREMLYQPTTLIKATLWKKIPAIPQKNSSLKLQGTTSKKKKARELPQGLTPESNNKTSVLQKSPLKDNTEKIQQLAMALKKLLQAKVDQHLTTELIEKFENENVKNVQKLHCTLMQSVKLPKEAILYLVGDLHGDTGPIKALLKKLTAENAYNAETGKISNMIYIALLGDYIDRGRSSLGVLDQITKLITVNPDQIILLRGNHECKDMALHEEGFLSCLKKFITDSQKAKDILNEFLQVFWRLPVAVFIEHGDQKHRFALVHGCVNPIMPAKQADIIKSKLNSSETSLYWALEKGAASTYLWSDVAYSDQEIAFPQKNQNRGDYGFLLYKNHVREWLKKFELQHLFRAHQQQNDLFLYTKVLKFPYLMFSGGPHKGVGSWNGLATTLNLAPDTGYYDNTEFFEENDFYCKHGTFIRVHRTIKKTESDPSTPAATAATKRNSRLTMPPFIPGIEVECINFDPKTHLILTPTAC